MLVTFRVEDTFTYVAFEGAGWQPGEVTSFHGEMRRRLEEGARRFVWNLQQLEKLNSITLGVFISSLKTVRDSGGCVVLHSVPAEAKEMLELTQISQYIDIFNTEEEARQHLARRR